ncbi:hypothetical protein [Acholeplasma granularum]|uniref:hypothetical protein n=1 Tax=Acholeplasma granularum TaxID=264635 RepID=UPI00046EFDAB|nr:hypothetical protein [Acholeplasma granularum]
MKKINKLVILILSIILSLSTAVGVYAWFTLQSTNEALDLNIRSTELFAASARIDYNGQAIDYNNARYESQELAISFNLNEISGATFNLNLKAIITAYKNINIRMKVTELWTVTSQNGNITRIYSPNIFTWNYATPNNLDSHKYYYHPSTIYKNDIPFSVDFVNNATINTTNLNALKNLNTNNNTYKGTITVKISMIISAIQANRSDLWSVSNPNHTTQQLALSAQETRYPIKVNFNGVSNPQFLRGIYIEFKSTTQHFSYLYHERQTPLLSRVLIPPGTYNVTINLVKHLRFTVSLVSGTITINIDYQPVINETSWAFEDTLYAPSVIPNWQENTAYSKGDIVYYDDAIDGGINAGYYEAIQNVAASSSHIPDRIPWGWKILSIIYNSSRSYVKGEIIYYTDNRFYMAKQSVPANTPPPLDWAWQPLGSEFIRGKTFVNGKYTYTNINDVIVYYIAYATFEAWSDYPESYQSFKKINYSFDTFNYNKYGVGEYVEYQGNHYRIIASVTNGTNPLSSPTIFRRISYDYSNRAYVQNSIVRHNGNYYIANTAISSGQTPGVSPNWTLIGSPTPYDPESNYNRYQGVTYNGKRYFWNGLTSTTGTNPDTNNNWWYVGEEWHPNNIYEQDSIVSYQNRYYTLRGGNSRNQAPGVAGLWQPLSLEWSKTGEYYNSGSAISVVLYKGAYYKWSRTVPANITNNGIPGEYDSGWNELTDFWIPNNTYVKGDFVRYDGSFWELLSNTSPTGQSGVPGIDFNVWKEHPIIWDPNRN